jgi:hypothetical protein
MISRSRITINLALTTVLVTAAFCSVAKADAGTSISASFNSTAIAGGRYIWFTAVAQTSGLGKL